MSNVVIGPDHPLVKSGAIQLTPTNHSSDPKPIEKPTILDGYDLSTIPSHPATHGNRTDPETTTASSANDDGIDVYDFGGGTAAPASTMPRGQSGAADTPNFTANNMQQSMSFAVSAFGNGNNASPFETHKSKHKGHTDPTGSGETASLSNQARKKGKKRKKKKKRSEKTNIEDIEPDTTHRPRPREFASIQSKWKAAKNVMNATSDMLHQQQFRRSQSAPDEIGATTDHSKMAPCPSPSHIRGTLRKTGMVQPRTVWNPSPQSHHIEANNDGSITLAQRKMQKEAMELYHKNTKREKKKLKKLKRKLLLKKKFIAHAKTVQAVFRFSNVTMTDEEGNVVEKVRAVVINDKDATEEDMKEQDATHTTSPSRRIIKNGTSYYSSKKASDNGEVKTTRDGGADNIEHVDKVENFTLRKLTPLEIEEREQAKIEALRAFKEEQKRLVEEARKKKEMVWRQNWKDMHAGHVATLDKQTPKKLRTTEEEKMEAKKQRDKEIMRQQRKRIRLRERNKIAAQVQLARLNKEHSAWVQSELKKDAILASGKHLGVEEMLFVVQARHSESCHPAYTNHVTDGTSRKRVPVERIHPSFHGYTLKKREKNWEEEGQLEQISIEQKQEEDRLHQIKQQKIEDKNKMKLAKLNAQQGSRKDRREYAKMEEAAKQKKIELKKKVKKEKREAVLYTPLEEMAMLTINGKREINQEEDLFGEWTGRASSVVHPSCCGSGGSASAASKTLKTIQDVAHIADSCSAHLTVTTAILKVVKGTVLQLHPGCIHKKTMPETLALSKSTSLRKKKATQNQMEYDQRYKTFVTKNEFIESQSHPSWSGIWKHHTFSRTVANVHVINPAYFQRKHVLLHPPTPPVTPRNVYAPPLKWEKPMRCLVCQAPPGVLGRPGCPACFEAKATLPWLYPKRSMPEIFDPPFERDHGVVRLRSNRKKNKLDKEKRRKNKAMKQAKLKFDMESQSAIIEHVHGMSNGGGNSGGAGGSSILDLNKERKMKRENEKNLDLATQKGLIRAAKLANYHTPMIDRKALLQHRRSGGIAYVTVWVKTIPGGTCVRLVLDKHESIERLKFLFLTNSGEYGPESWGYMVLPTDKGCYFLDSRIRYKSELHLGYRPGDRDLTDYGVGEPNAGNEVVILMVSAGGGRTELNTRTMSEMLRRYFFQNASTDNDAQGQPVPIPVNIIERIMKGRWGSDGAPTCFPGEDRSQHRLIVMCKNQLRIKKQAFEMDMEIIKNAEKLNRAVAYRKHLKESLKIKLNSYKLLKTNLSKEKKKMKRRSSKSDLNEQDMMLMIDTMNDKELRGMSTTDLLRKGHTLSKKRKLNNRLKMITQKEKRFIASTKARTLANHDDIPMYVFRKWQPPPPKPLPPPPPPRRPGILTRFARGTYKYLLKPIGSGVVGTIQKIKELRQTLKEMQEDEEFESDSEEEEEGGGDESDDELGFEAEPVDVFAMAEEEEDGEEEE